MTKPRITQGKQKTARSGLDGVRSLARPDDWAVGMGLRVDGRPFSLTGREYVRAIIRDNSPEIWCPKAAQMAFTVTAVTKSIHNVTERGWNGLYLLPLKTGAVPFVQARIDPVIESNPQLEAKFGSVDNRLHKQTNAHHNLYIRGTNILRELQEIPVDFQMWDEYDRMVIENLSDARHRMDGSVIRKLMVLSTPTVEGYGVYGEDGWDLTDQHRWEVACPGCGRYQVLNFNDPEMEYNNLKVGENEWDCVLECAFCNRVIRDEERPGMNATGRWTCFKPDGRLRGYYITQFNSPTQPLYEIMADYFKGRKDARKIRSFWNQNMGRPYTALGDKITPELLDKCRQPGYSMGGIPNNSLAVGIDVGTVIHVWCWHFDRSKRKLLWQVRNFMNWGDLDNFLAGLTSWRGVIDAHPEKSKAHDLAMKYHGKLWVGFEEDRDQQSEMANFNTLKVGEAGKVNIDRTMAFDTFINDLINGNVILPADARELGENMPRKPFNGLYSQLIQMVRIEEERPNGQIRGRWRKNRSADHWHHAGMFATVAAMQTPTLDVPANLAAAFQRGGNLVGAS